MQRIIPYAFHGLDYLYDPKFARFYNLIPELYTQKLGEGFLNQTSLVYTSLLQSIAEQDKDYLQQILEPKLYHAISHSMDLLQGKQLQLQYVEQEQQDYDDDQDEEEQWPQSQFKYFSENIKKNLQLFSQIGRGSYKQFHIYQEKGYKCNIDVRGIFGVKINRIENENTRFFQIPAFPKTPRSYFVNLKNPFSLYENQILVANILIYTSKKLIAIDQEGKIVHGNYDNNQYQYHKLRLESYVPNFNWVITDIDDYLKGNPYF